MDITSYLLGKNASGGGGGDVSKYFEATIGEGSSSASAPTAIMKMIKTIPDNTIVSGYSLAYSFRNYQGETIPLLDTSQVTNMSSMFYNCSNLTTIPLLNTSQVTHMGSMFNGCSKLTTIPQLDTSKAQYMSSMFSGCSKLTTIPVLNTSSAIQLNNIVVSCTSLTNESLDNILQMCINATSFTGTKTLDQLGLRSTNYPVERIQALPSYQDFIDAGWTIGY